MLIEVTLKNNIKIISKITEVSLSLDKLIFIDKDGIPFYLSDFKDVKKVEIVYELIS